MSYPKTEDGDSKEENVIRFDDDLSHWSDGWTNPETVSDSTVSQTVLESKYT